MNLPWGFFVGRCQLSRFPGFFQKHSSFNKKFVMKFLSKYHQCLLQQHSTALGMQKFLSLILLLPLSNKFFSDVQAVPCCINDISTNLKKKLVLYLTWEVMGSVQTPSPMTLGAVSLMQGLQRASRHDAGGMRDVHPCKAGWPGRQHTAFQSPMCKWTVSSTWSIQFR